MARENHLWGAERIRGELLKLGIHVAKRTIPRHLRAGRSTFLKTHAKDVVDLRLRAGH